MQSDTIDLLAAALVAAQADIHNAAKTATNPHLNSRYADLASVREAVVGPMAKHGLVVSQTFTPRIEPLIVEYGETRGGREVRYPVQSLGSLRTTLIHASGQWLASELPILCAWGDPQKLGSVISYYRRYALAAIAGIAQEDDDAASVAPRPQQIQTGQRPAPRSTQAPAQRPSAPAPQSVQPQTAPAQREPGEDQPERIQFHELEPRPARLWAWAVENGYKDELSAIGHRHQFAPLAKDWTDHQRDIAWAELNNAEPPPAPVAATNGDGRRGSWGGGR